MVVYIVINSSLTHCSSYWDIVQVCSSFEDACSTMGTCAMDFRNDKHPLPEFIGCKEYVDKEVPDDWNTHEHQIVFVGEDNFYNKFFIEKHTVY